MNYIVKGHFYITNEKVKTIKARSVLTITCKDLDVSSISTYDLLVIMMNPGCSKPKNDTEWFENSAPNFSCLSEADPDDTQFQIMRVMDKTGFKNTVILNLSDVCETSSKEFAKKVDGLNYSKLGESHSIFSDSRVNELSKILNHVRGDVTILASGVDYKLRYLTSQMLNKIRSSNLISVPHENGQFYHPLPRGGQKKWVSEIVRKLS